MAGSESEYLENLWREAFTPPDRLPVWQWAEQHIEGIPYSPIPGRFQSVNSPMLREVMQEMVNPRTRVISIIASVQSSKSTAIEIALCYIVANMPGPTLWLDQNDDDAKEMAKTEWIPSALGTDGRTQGYEPLLASADAGRRPDMDQVLVITGPQHLESVLADLLGKNNDPLAFIDTRTPVLDAVENKLVRQNPTLGGNIGQAGEAGATVGGGGQELGPRGENPRPAPDNPDPVEPTPTPPEPPHPTPYPGQS